MKLLEISEFTTQYMVKKLSKTRFEVAKFRDDKQPESISDVHMLSNGHFDSPGYRNGQQNDRAIAIVKQFLEDDEPLGVYYTVDPNKKITQHKLFDTDKMFESENCTTIKGTEAEWKEKLLAVWPDAKFISRGREVDTKSELSHKQDPGGYDAGHYNRLTEVGTIVKRVSK